MAAQLKIRNGNVQVRRSPADEFEDLPEGEWVRVGSLDIRVREKRGKYTLDRYGPAHNRTFRSVNVCNGRYNFGSKGVNRL